MTGPPHPAAPPRGKIYLQFECWNERTNAFETLPADVPVELVHYNSVLANKVLDTQKTDAKGCVEFETSDLQKKNGGSLPSIFFLAKTKGISIGPNKLPDEWPTKAWKARDGQPGFWKEFVGNRLGDAGTPLVFRIGLDFHVRWTYERPRHTGDGVACEGMPVTIYVSSGRKKDLKTDKNGEIHGLVLDIPQEPLKVNFEIWFQVEDSRINLPRTKVMTDWGMRWDTGYPDDDRFLISDSTELSIGTQSSPRIIRAKTKERNVAFYFLKIAREWAAFFYYITDHAWTGVTELQMNTTCVSGSWNAFSWPVGTVNIGSDHHWSRGTLIHELSHQVMWKESAISSLAVGGYVVNCFDDDLKLKHSRPRLTNELHALIEGWAEFVDFVFNGGPFAFTQSPDGSSLLLDGSKLRGPLNQGQKVEGAFANALFDMFRFYVTGDATKTPIPETLNGDLLGVAPWIDSKPVKDRFKAMIWDPLKDLASQSRKDTPAFIAKMRSMHPAGWHALVGHMQTWNVGMKEPSISNVSPAAGPVAGGQEATITGNDFVLGTQLKIGGVSVPVTVENSTTLKYRVPPGRPGEVDLEVITTSGSDKRRYRYVP
jgi:hypothetical protein